MEENYSIIHFKEHHLHQVKKLYASHIGFNPTAGNLMSQGELEVELIPQGTLEEQIRFGGAWLVGVWTPTGLGTTGEDNNTHVIVYDKKYLPYRLILKGVEKPILNDN